MFSMVQIYAQYFKYERNKSEKNLIFAFISLPIYIL